MKKILMTIVALAAMLTLAVADTAVSTQATGATFNLISTGGKTIDYVTIVPAGTNMTVRLYDLAGTTLTYTNAAYSYKYETNATVVTSFVDPLGNTNNYTNTVLVVATNSIGAATNNYTPIASYGAAGSLVTTFTDKFALSKGLTISNSHAATIIVGYH